ncbi:MAG: hypothetical protein WDK96_03570 [Candidatus Paceibacterota bacterium]|jgi:hypothetical protein
MKKLIIVLVLLIFGLYQNATAQGFINDYTGHGKDPKSNNLYYSLWNPFQIEVGHDYIYYTYTNSKCNKIDDIYYRDVQYDTQIDGILSFVPLFILVCIFSCNLVFILSNKKKKLKEIIIYYIPYTVVILGLFILSLYYSENPKVIYHAGMISEIILIILGGIGTFLKKYKYFFVFILSTFLSTQSIGVFGSSSRYYPALLGYVAIIIGTILISLWLRKLIITAKEKSAIKEFERISFNNGNRWV